MSMIPLTISDIIVLWYRFGSPRAGDVFPDIWQYCTLTKGILIWRYTRQSWNSSYFSSWSMPPDLVACSSFIFRTNVSDNSEIAAEKDDSIDSGNECNGPPCPHSGKSLDGSNQGSICPKAYQRLDSRRLNQTRTQRLQILTNIVVVLLMGASCFCCWYVGRVCRLNMFRP